MTERTNTVFARQPSALVVSGGSASNMLPTTDELAAMAGLRNAIRAVDGLQTRSAPLLAGVRHGEPQNAIDWSTILVTVGMSVPATVSANVLFEILLSWARRHREHRRTLRLRFGDTELVIEDATEAEGQRVLDVVARWLDAQ